MIETRLVASRHKLDTSTVAFFLSLKHVPLGHYFDTYILQFADTVEKLKSIYQCQESCTLINFNISDSQ